MISNGRRTGRSRSEERRVGKECRSLCDWSSECALPICFEGDEGAWEGTATELFNILNEKTDDDLKRSKDWPKQPNKLTEQLNRLGPSLAEIGVYVVRGASHKRGRKIKVFCAESPRK